MLIRDNRKNITDIIPMQIRKKVRTYKKEAYSVFMSFTSLLSISANEMPRGKGLKLKKKR